MNNESILKTQIRLSFDNGLDEKGEPIEVVRNFNSVDPAAENEKIKQFSQSYASLTTLTYHKVSRINELEIA